MKREYYSNGKSMACIIDDHVIIVDPELGTSYKNLALVSGVFSILPVKQIMRLGEPVSKQQFSDFFDKNGNNSDVKTLWLKLEEGVDFTEGVIPDVTPEYYTTESNKMVVCIIGDTIFISPPPEESENGMQFQSVDMDPDVAQMKIMLRAGFPCKREDFESKFSDTPEDQEVKKLWLELERKALTAKPSVPTSDYLDIIEETSNH